MGGSGLSRKKEIETHMKLCFLATADSVHSYRWIKYFADRGHEIYWLSLGVDGKSDTRKTKFYLIKKIRGRPLRPLFYTICVKEILKKIKPDIFHVHQAWIDGIVGALSGFHPFILTVWGSDVLSAEKSKVKRPLVKFALNKAALITCDAEHMVDVMVNLGVDQRKIKVICFGVDTHRFCSGESDKDLVDKLGISNSPVVISLRSLRPLYDIESLINSVPLVLKEIPEAKFLIAGKGPQEVKLRDLAGSLGVSNSVRFVGSIPNNQLPQYLRLADIYVSTALSDAGIAASTAEAMACGLPVIITDFGDNRKWVQHGVNGYIIPLKSPEVLASSIIQLVRNKDIRKTFGQINREIIVERNNWEKEMAKMERLYQELILEYKKQKT